MVTGDGIHGTTRGDGIHGTTRGDGIHGTTRSTAGGRGAAAGTTWIFRGDWRRDPRDDAPGSKPGRRAWINAGTTLPRSNDARSTQVAGGPADAYEALVAAGDAGAEWTRPEDEWDALAVNYTSGTTGRPKGVVVHHRGAYVQALSNCVDFDGLQTDGVVRSFAARIFSDASRRRRGVRLG